MIYFISDTHFNHDRDFIYGPRGFSNVEQSNETIKTNWNNTIKKDDDIYVVGDFFLGNFEEANLLKEVESLNGQIHLIRGNHDSPAKIKVYEKCSNIVEIVWATQIDYNKRHFYLSHYPTLTADLQSNPDKCVINIFGHTHSKDKFYEDCPYLYNVACDAHNCTPVSIDEVFSDIQAKIKSVIN